MGHLLNKIISIFVFLSLIILPMALAATEDFQYTAPSSVDVCACTNLALEGSLVNIGDVTSHYFVSDVGTASPWTQSVPEYFSLDPGIERDVVTFVNVPCNANGAYTLYTKIESSLGLDKIHAAMVNVQKCNIVDVTPVKVKHEVCAGDVAVYEFRVKNKGGFVEEVQPSVSGLNRYSEFNLPLYTLDVGEVEPVYLYLASFDKTGLYELNVTLTAHRSGFEYTVPIEYNAVDCAPTISIEESSGDYIDSDDSEGVVIPIMPLLYTIIALLAILLLLLLILLIVKAVKKKKSGRTLEEWIEVPAEKKEPKKEEKKVVAEVKKKPAKKVKKKPKKPVDKEKIKKVLLWILIILLALLLLGLVIWGIIAAWSNVSDWASALGNETANMTANMTDNVTAGVNDTLGSQNITQQPLAPVDNVSSNASTVANQSLNTTDITGANPVVSFFTNYGSSCAMIISLFLVLFVLSLLLLGIKAKDEWSDKKKFFMKYLKYALPILFFICLVFTFIFCVFNNIPDETWPGRCSVVIIENATDANVSLNATQLMNQSNVVVEKQALGDCACSTLFGTSTPTWLCILIVILVILLILFIIWLIMMIPFWWAAFKNRPKKPKKEKKKEVVKVVKKTEKKKKQESNIWKDILLLLILLLLLFLIGFFFRSCELYTPLNETNTTDNLSLINGTNVTSTNVSQNESDDSGNDTQGLVVISPSTEDMVEAPVDQNLVCDVRFFFDLDDNNSISLIPDELKGIKESDLVYSWYLDRDGDGNYEDVQVGTKSKKISSSQIEVDDIWRCEASFTASDGKVYSVDSAPYIVVPIEEAAVILPPTDDSDDIGVANVSDNNISDNVTMDQNATNVTEEIDPELVKVNELLAYIEENNLTDSFTYFVMESGETEDVNLSQYFVDPDGDELFFNVEEVTSGNVSVDIWKGIATISAEDEFIGIVNATFSAEDPLGEKVVGEMTIVVKPSEKSTFSDWWEDYGNYVIVGIIIVALLVVVVILYNRIMEDDEEVKEKKKESEKKESTGFFKNF